VIVTSSTRNKALAELPLHTWVAAFRLATGKLSEMRNKDIKVLHAAALAVPRH
jgi:hypothetical protein